MADEDRTFSPSDVEAARTRMQGNGVGQREMDAGRDPNRPQGADQYDFDGDANPQEDGGDPSMEAQTGADHTRHPDRTEACVARTPRPATPRRPRSTAATGGAPGAAS